MVMEIVQERTDEWCHMGNSRRDAREKAEGVGAEAEWRLRP